MDDYYFNWITPTLVCELRPYCAEYCTARVQWESAGQKANTTLVTQQTINLWFFFGQELDTLERGTARQKIILEKRCREKGEGEEIDLPPEALKESSLEQFIKVQSQWSSRKYRCVSAGKDGKYFLSKP